MHFQKTSHLITEYVLFVPACPCRLCTLTKMFKAKDLASNDLSASCIILYNMLSFLLNFFMTEGICSTLSMHL